MKRNSQIESYLWGCPSQAEQVHQSIETYWQSIITSCFLDAPDPKVKWRHILKELHSIAEYLNQLQIEKLIVQGHDYDLELRFGKNRRWLFSQGKNIPSFEIFTSPDWRGTNGWVRFNQPLYRFGGRMDKIKLEFKNGSVTKVEANTNQELLEKNISILNANKVGEFSLTDNRLSPLTKPMAITLFDENIGGNMHLALGRSFLSAYQGTSSPHSLSEIADLGFNDSPEHIDIISTSDMTVKAVLDTGKERLIYEHGQFTFYKP